MNGIKLSDLRHIAQRMAKARLDELALCHEGVSVRMRFAPQQTQPGSPPAPVMPPPQEDLPSDRTATITATGPGQFLPRHPAHEQNYVAPGSQITAGDLLGVIRMGGVYLPLYSPVTGTVTRLHPADEYVEYGQPVVVVEQAV
ncbi:acetyl-CoA carboxylase biotin carboxyl carrier protein [Tatumella terrea]|uniref:Acetyl-CoA carboxylase biotin carboxyl carrier protein n=1 Tax=Tatumella terrea TaxID=419007 RepID=A0ABW1VTI8_9GAMM